MIQEGVIDKNMAGEGKATINKGKTEEKNSQDAFTQIEITETIISSRM